jgi:hypothetical protein
MKNCKWNSGNKYDKNAPGFCLARPNFINIVECNSVKGTKLSYPIPRCVTFLKRRKQNE